MSDLNLNMDQGACKVSQLTERSEQVKESLISRLSRIEGQVRGVKKMIENGAYCDDVLTQISSVRAGMSSVALLLLDSHMRNCVTDRLKNDDDEIIEEFVKTVGRLL